MATTNAVQMTWPQLLTGVVGTVGLVGTIGDALLNATVSPVRDDLKELKIGLGRISDKVDRNGEAVARVETSVAYIHERVSAIAMKLQVAAVEPSPTLEPTIAIVAKSGSTASDLPLAIRSGNATIQAWDAVKGEVPKLLGSGYSV